MSATIEILGRDRLIQAGRALAAEADGYKLKRDLAAMFRVAAEPAVSESKRRVQSIPSVTPHDVPIRAAVIRGLKVRTRFTGASAGIRITAAKTQQVRNFANAPRRLNSGRGWRHPIFGRPGSAVQQYGDPGWFQEPIIERKEEFLAAAMVAVKLFEARVAARCVAGGLNK